MANARRADKAPAEENFGTFSKDGRDDVTAYSRKRAVQLRYEGWVDKSTGTSSPPAEPPAAPES